jgi:hypothetical protein
MSLFTDESGEGTYIAIFSFDLRGDLVILKGCLNSDVVADGTAVRTAHSSCRL